jgi:L-threonylcarbamoyladenylate synthase
MTLTLRVDARHPEPRIIARAAGAIRRGLLVAYPTETFYALGGDPTSPAAVDRVFEAKGRPGRMPLPLIAAEIRDLRRCTGDLPDTALRLAAAFWPGALTLVVPATGLPARLLGGGRTVGVRLSPHPVAAALARAHGGPIIATSANRSGQPPPRTADGVRGALGDAVDLVLDGGATAGGPASTVLDVTVDPPRVVRAGAVPVADLGRVLGGRLG